MIDVELCKIGSKSLAKLLFSFENADFDSVSIVLNELDDIEATTEGSIRGNEIFIGKPIREFQCFISCPVFSFTITLTFLKNKKIIHYDNVSITVPEIKESKEIEIPVVSSANLKRFKEKIQDGFLGDLAQIVKTEDELSIQMIDNPSSLFVCLGELSHEVKKNDLCFSIEKEIKKINVPLELIVQRFMNSEIALHVLVKPEFQKNIDNLYYKSKISNTIKVEDMSIEKRRIGDFENPVCEKLNPLEWVIDWETQLPHFVN